jgi:hypothetical protein
MTPCTISPWPARQSFTAAAARRAPLRLAVAAPEVRCGVRCSLLDVLVFFPRQLEHRTPPLATGRPPPLALALLLRRRILIQRP